MTPVLQAWLYFCVLVALVAMFFMVVTLAMNSEVSGEKLVTVISFGGILAAPISTVAGYIAGYRAGKAGESQLNNEDKSGDQEEKERKE